MVNISLVKDIFDKLNKLKLQNTKKGKANILSEYCEDECFLKVLQFLLDSNVVTNLSSKKIKKEVDPIDTSIDTLDELLFFLENNCTGKDTDIALVQSFINKHPYNQEDLIQLCTKKMKLGVTAKSVNEALGYRAIFEFNTQLADKFQPKYIKNKRFIISTKVDGIKCICIVCNGDVKFYSRQGKEIIGLDDIKKAIKELNLKDFVFDGELYFNGTVANSKEGYKKTMNQIGSKNGKLVAKGNLKYLVYDCVTSSDEFYNGYCEMTTLRRKQLVKDLLLNRSKYLEYLGELYIGDDEQVIYDYLKEADDNGEEGIIVSIGDAPWEAKRTKGCLKVKSFFEGDVFVDSMYDGDGKLMNLMGGVNCSFIYKGEVHHVSVGSGFRDDERLLFMSHPEKIIGKVITISYFEVTETEENGRVSYSLRYPTITTPYPYFVRQDKTTLEETNIEG